ncbi:olfactory receptor 10AG1-like [Spea bombifrons]|uniref:olfactory receptor 10AG1-like n=1 Tax=Spea bombifrons TaxID=233779 RepID=UPI00234AF49B|nr:olfactory receptor 10AG1-like [Spea bombifrons]
MLGVTKERAQETSDMERVLRTNVTEFVLLGFSDLSQSLQAVLFTFLLSAYLLTLFGNGLILFTVTLDRGLHTPMYFFLRNLSFIELFFTTVTIPKVLSDFRSQKRSISFYGCATQMFVFFAVGVTECVFLAVMAFDRYMAICRPLRYLSVMSRKLCYKLTVGSWLTGLLVSLGQTTFIFTLPYCASNHLEHFFCDIPPLLSVACSNTFINQLSVFMACLTGATIPFVLILCSYVRILSSITLIRSAEGRHKALSTCGSHLASVILFYGTAMFMYLRLGSRRPTGNDRPITLFYCMVIPAINPLIYSLRNKDMKRALVKLVVKPLGGNEGFRLDKI